MNELIEVFGEIPTQELIDGLHVKPQYKDDYCIGAIFYIETDNIVHTSYESDLQAFESSNYDNETLIESIKEDIEDIKKSKDDFTTVNISKALQQILVRLGTQLYGNAATKEKVSRFENDFWFVRLRDLLHQKQSYTRKQFMRLATYWYVLIEIEGYTEKEVIDVLSNNKAKMHEIVEKRNVKNLSDFIEKVHYIASTKQIEHFIQIIKNSSASEEVKNELIESLLASNILDTWHN
ncbi:TPA: hypothetical protein PBT65_001748 [Staphylococcus aureus]|nr:hypothetical protein [Staphylococcus aureus]